MVSPKDFVWVALYMIFPKRTGPWISKPLLALISVKTSLTQCAVGFVEREGKTTRSRALPNRILHDLVELQDRETYNVRAPVPMAYVMRMRRMESVLLYYYEADSDNTHVYATKLLSPVRLDTRQPLTYDSSRQNLSPVTKLYR